MKKLKEDKLSLTMREALARNALMENKMKADMSSLSTDAKRNLQSLEFYKNKYQARQKELEMEKHRNASNNGARKISAPSRLMMNTEYQDLLSGEMITDLTSFRKQERSISDTLLPQIYRCENAGKLPVIVANPKAEGLLLPSIGSSANSNGRQRRLSATNMSYSRPGSPGCLLTAPANIAQSRSAPSSPRTPKRDFSGWTRSPSPGGFRKNSTGDFGEELALKLDKALLQRRASDQGAGTKDDGLHEQERKAMQEPKRFPTKREKSASANRESKDVKVTRKISSPGTALNQSTAGNTLNNEHRKSLEESMNDVRFCKYLRTASLEEDIKQGKLPDELVPKVIIVGHTEWVPGD